jgi:hypothetical protein
MNREQRRNLQRQYSQRARQFERLYGGEKVCVICGKKFTGLGHNQAPVVMPSSQVWEPDRRCCLECNGTKVIPMRRKWQKQGKRWDDRERMSLEEIEELSEITGSNLIVHRHEQEN